MSSVVKALFGFYLLLFCPLILARDIHVLVVGDQLASNCHVRMYGPIAGIYQLGLDGNERQASDPLDRADCRAGSIWMPFAARLKQQPGVDKVVLMIIGVAGAKAQDFNHGLAAARLNSALVLAKQRGLHFDYALWQQGVPDFATPGKYYLSQMRAVIKSASLKIRIDKWLIGNVTCAGVSLPQVTDSQALLAGQFVLNRFPGPTKAKLDGRAQMPDCRLTALGQEIMAQRWFNAIQRADSLSKRYQDEALISLFK